MNYAKQDSNKLKILISAYACSPYHGSEPGLGWQIVKNLSKHHELHVITEEVKFRPDIEKKLREEPGLKENLHFHFIPKKRRKLLRKIWPPSYYWYYKEWQKDAYFLALELTEKYSFDVLHQFNMIGYREPGYFWKINDIPLVWGPVGGFAQLKWSFIPSLSLKDAVFYTARNIYNSIQMRTSKRVKKMVDKSDLVISAAIDSYQKFKDHFDKDSVLINETGANVNNVVKVEEESEEDEKIDLVWVGGMVGRKALPIALKAVNKLPRSIDYRFHIVGDGPNLDKWKQLSINLGISSSCKFYGRLTHEATQEVIASADLMLFPSLQEGTPHVVLEALSHGTPVICHDANGQSTVINEKCGNKIPMISPKVSIERFSEAIINIEGDREVLKSLSKEAKKRANELSWENKANEIANAYEQAISNFDGS